MKYISTALILLITRSAYAELTTEYPATNQVCISRNGELLLIKDQIAKFSWMEQVIFKGKTVLLRTGPLNRTQVFYGNTPINVVISDTDNDGQPDLIQLMTAEARGKIVLDALYIGPDGRLTPISDQDLQAGQEAWSTIINSQQAGPGYPPQGVGSPDP